MEWILYEYGMNMRLIWDECGMNIIWIWNEYGMNIIWIWNDEYEMMYMKSWNKMMKL